MRMWILKLVGLGHYYKDSALRNNALKRTMHLETMQWQLIPNKVIIQKCPIIENGANDFN